MAEEDFSDLGEVKLTHYDGTRWTSGWGRSPGSGVTTLPYQYHRTFPHSYQNNPRAAEAEDIMGHHYNHTSRTHHKTGLYYSPPGTSYTIMEQQPSSLSASHQKFRARGTGGLVSSSIAASSSAPTSKILSNSNSNKKRPISPEQVLKLFSSHGGGRNHNNNTTSNHLMNNINSSKSPISTETHAQHTHRHRPPDIDKLPVKTISMTRETPPGSGNHGFGICVKGGSKKPGNLFWNIELLFKVLSEVT